MLDLAAILTGSALTIFSYQVCRVAYRLSPYFSREHNILKDKENSYVVVAGSTDGIGRAFLNQMTRRNIHVIAIGRNTDKLAAIQQELPNIATQQLDFASMSLQTPNIENVAEGLGQQINGRDPKHRGKIVGIVNSVGSAHFSQYDSLTAIDINKLNSTNLNSLHFLLKLHQNLQKLNLTEPNTFFINISSAVAKNPNKYSSVYAATKAYISRLIEAVSVEKKDVIFLDVRPWYVKTKMVGYQKSWDSVDPNETVLGSLRVLGKRAHCSGCWKHELIDEFYWWLQDGLRVRVQQKMSRAVRLSRVLRERKGK